MSFPRQKTTRIVYGSSGWHTYRASRGLQKFIYDVDGDRNEIRERKCYFGSELQIGSGNKTASLRDAVQANEFSPD